MIMRSQTLLGCAMFLILALDTADSFVQPANLGLVKGTHVSLCPSRTLRVPKLRMASNSEEQFDDASMEAFRALMEDSWDGPSFDDDEDKDFDGYQFRDMIVEKWGVPYDIQIKREMFLGKPMIFLNVMWKYLGQQSFYLDEQEYLEHLQAIAELCVKWEKVEHLKQVVAESKKRPNAYFGYAVALPLDLPADVMDELNIPESQ